MREKECLNALPCFEVIHRDTMLGQDYAVVPSRSLGHPPLLSFSSNTKNICFLRTEWEKGGKCEGPAVLPSPKVVVTLHDMDITTSCQELTHSSGPLELPIEMWAYILSIIHDEASATARTWPVMMPLALVCRDWFSLVFSNLSAVDCETQKMPRSYLPFLCKHAVHLKELCLHEGAGDEGMIIRKLLFCNPWNKYKHIIPIPTDVALISSISTLQELGYEFTTQHYFIFL